MPRSPPPKKIRLAGKQAAADAEGSSGAAWVRASAPGEPRAADATRKLDVDDLPTPCYVGYRSVIARNAERMLSRAKDLGCKLRPHMKTHKTAEGAVLATGGTKRCIAVSTLAEAEFYADHGFDDICYAVPITKEKLPRAFALLKRLQAFHVSVDHPAAVEALCGFYAAPRKWSVFLMVDCGYGRDGVDPAEAASAKLAQRLATSGNTQLVGLYTHGGHSYDARGASETSAAPARRVAAVAEAEGEAVAGFAAKLRKAPWNLQVPVVGVGSTPTCSNPPEQGWPGVTEMHPGNYIYYDTMQESLGSCQEEDIAVRVLMRVIGAYEKKNLLLVDMGWTACSKQGEQHDFGRIENHPELRVVNLKQEAGLISSSDGDPLDFARFPLGTLLRLEPYHSCAHTKQHDKFLWPQRLVSVQVLGVLGFAENRLVLHEPDLLLGPGISLPLLFVCSCFLFWGMVFFPVCFCFLVFFLGGEEVEARNHNPLVV
ncbi:unnamed protein product [Effrenium voratum]|nr:unnamed protein product [Effrenium voratum]